MRFLKSMRPDPTGSAASARSFTLPVSTINFPFLVDGRNVPVFCKEAPLKWRDTAEAKGFRLVARAQDRLHVILGCLSCGLPTLKRISVVLGYEPECPHCIHTKREAAEEVVTGDISSGAGGDRYSDLFRATDLAIDLEQKFGFGTSLIYAGVPAKKRYRMPDRIQARVDERLTSAYELAADLIVEHRDLVEAVAAALVEHRELDRTALLSILTANLPSTTQTNREITR